MPNEKPPMEYLGHGLLYRTQSSTRVNVSHITILEPETGNYMCTGEGFRSHKHCWHTDKIKPKDADTEDYIVTFGQ